MTQNSDQRSFLRLQDSMGWFFHTYIRLRGPGASLGYDCEDRVHAWESCETSVQAWDDLQGVEFFGWRFGVAAFIGLY